MLEDIKNALPVEEVNEGQNDRHNTNQSSNNHEELSARPLTPVYDTKAQLTNLHINLPSFMKKTL